MKKVPFTGILQIDFLLLYLFYMVRVYSNLLVIISCLKMYNISFRYLNWHPGEPNNVRFGAEPENCAEMVPSWNYQWNDKYCSKEEVFICKKNGICIFFAVFLFHKKYIVHAFEGMDIHVNSMFLL
jgi:hypothetical protein